MKIAFFGGSFDPPHHGHDSIVKMALNSLQIDKLIIMPTFINPFKNGFAAPPNLRLSWINKIWSNLEKVVISDYEILQNRPVPTIESILHIKKLYNPSKIYLLLGADHLATLHKWHKFELLSNLVEFVIANRDHIEIPPNLQKLNINVNISSSFIREQLDTNEVDELLKNEVKEFYKGIQMEKITKKIYEILDEKKAENIEIIDMTSRDYIAKFVVIATTLASKHALSLVDELKAGLKAMGEKHFNIESSDDWTIVDLGDILVHLMSENYRAKYNIEEFLVKLKEGKA